MLPIDGCGLGSANSWSLRLDLVLLGCSIVLWCAVGFVLSVHASYLGVVASVWVRNLFSLMAVFQCLLVSVVMLSVGFCHLFGMVASKKRIYLSLRFLPGSPIFPSYAPSRRACVFA